MDYKKIGFKCGLELHVQLDVGKLFCPCPSVLRNDDPDYIIRRKLTAVEGELGEVDVAARLEKIKDKTFVYEGYNHDNCLVEIDEEPPHPINNEALTAAMEIALMLKMKPVDQVFVMRKTVVDGSNTSGFQRTALVAQNGYLDTNLGKISIAGLNAEEDSARKIKSDSKNVFYRLDRLGIPLVEISTGPDILSPDHAREVAEKIGLITRMTGTVMRGIGTIRQDVNVSISGGERIEIKGFQDLKMIPVVIGNEVLRQQELLKIKSELKGKRKPAYNFLNLTELFKNSKSKLAGGKEVFGMKVQGFKGLTGREINPNRRLGTELSDYAKLYGGVKGIIHSDELPNYGIENVNDICKALKCSKNDAFILVVAPKDNAINALKAVHKRILECFTGIPKEVRNAQPDGTTNFMRPMPGAARLYPETDLKPLVLKKSYIDDVISSLPETPEAKLKSLMNRGLTQELARQIIHSRELMIFEKLFEEFENPKLLASAILYAKDSLSYSDYKKLFLAFEKGSLSKEAITDVITSVLEGKNFESVMKNYKPTDTKNIEADVKLAVKTFGEKGFAVVMGELMKKYRGKVSGQKLSEMVKKELKNK